MASRAWASAGKGALLSTSWPPSGGSRVDRKAAKPGTVG